MERLGIFLWYSVALIGVMILAEISFRFFKWSSEWTRKLAHIGSGIIALTYPYFIDNHWIVFALTLSFTLILYTSKKMGLFSSIFAVGRKSYGELLFVWTTWFLFLIFQYTNDKVFYVLPFSIVVFADPAAALIGKNFAVKKYHIIGNEKSYLGSFAFFIVSVILGYYFLQNVIPANQLLVVSILHAAVLTVVEAISGKGFDNITIPMVSVTFLYFIL